MKLVVQIFACIVSVGLAQPSFAAPDGQWTLTIKSKRPWEMEIQVKDNVPTVIAAHGITPEGVALRKVSDDRLLFDVTFSKDNSCKTGSTMAFDLTFKSGGYKRGAVKGNCIGFPKFRAKVTAK